MTSLKIAQHQQHKLDLKLEDPMSMTHGAITTAEAVRGNSECTNVYRFSSALANKSTT